MKFSAFVLFISLFAQAAWGASLLERFPGLKEEIRIFEQAYRNALVNKSDSGDGAAIMLFLASAEEDLLAQGVSEEDLESLRANIEAEVKGTAQTVRDSVLEEEFWLSATRIYQMSAQEIREKLGSLFQQRQSFKARFEAIDRLVREGTPTELSELTALRMSTLFLFLAEAHRAKRLDTDYEKALFDELLVETLNYMRIRGNSPESAIKLLKVAGLYPGHKVYRHFYSYLKKSLQRPSVLSSLWTAGKHAFKSMSADRQFVFTMVNFVGLLAMVPLYMRPDFFLGSMGQIVGLVIVLDTWKLFIPMSKAYGQIRSQASEMRKLRVFARNRAHLLPPPICRLMEVL